MKNSAVFLAVALAAASSSRAQVSVEVQLEQDQFLAGEPMPAVVRVSNRSGQTLEFGKDAEWLTFSVESRDGFVVERNGRVPVEGEFSLESSKAAKRPVELVPYFNATKPGRYEIIATVRIKEWNGEVSSKPKGFSIVRGAKLWSQEFGVPRTTGSTNGAPEVRRYTLEQANYLRSQLRLYMRVTDVADSRTFKVQAIGPMVSFGDVEHEIDAESNLHVLWRTGARASVYAVFNPDGETILRQTHDYIETRPRLVRDERGKFSVAGGVRRITPNDVPSEAADDSAKNDKP